MNSNKKQNIVAAILVLCMATVMVACSKMFDNVKDFADSEIIYSDKLDGIIKVQTGYERIEIDLMKAGRIPSSKLNPGKAKKTVIECADFTEPDHRRVIDSVCSWLNITGLTQLKTYRFTIYTEDEFGNRSLPLTTEAKPYTSENRNALQLPAPSITESTSAAVIEWTIPISGKTHKTFRYAYEYTDKDGNKIIGKSEGDMPSFFVENVEKGKDIPIKLACRIIPTILGENGLYTPIIDTIDWNPEVKLHIADNAVPAIFLKTPINSITIDAGLNDFPVDFSWIKVPEANGYVLKLSRSANFPDAETESIDLGNVDSYEMDAVMAAQMFERFLASKYNLYWRIEPSASSTRINTQTRQFTAIRKPPLNVDPRFADDLLLDVAFFADGVAMDISPKKHEVLWHNGPGMSVAWNPNYNRLTARFNPATPSGNVNTYAGLYRYDYSADQVFKNAVSDGFSMELLMQNTVGSTGEQKPFCATEGGGFGFAVQIVSNVNRANFMVHTGAYVNVTPNIGLNQFYHFLGVWNQANRTVSFYLNGVFMGTNTTQATLMFPTAAVSQWVGVGGDAGPQAQALFAGEVVIARIYDSPLTVDDVTYLWNQVKP
jgi:hypothetical protein